MAKFLIDANLPFRVPIWQTDDFEFVTLINDEFSDTQIWNYALQNGLTIVTKDSDFSHRSMLGIPRPNVIHIRFGNMRLKEFIDAIEHVWPNAAALSVSCSLVNVFLDHVEGIN